VFLENFKRISVFLFEKEGIFRIEKRNLLRFQGEKHTFFIIFESERREENIFVRCEFGIQAYY
jgi:hypothetical protein